MPAEIERKYLVTGSEWRDAAAPSVQIRQAYIANTPLASVRVRIKGTKSAFLTIKGAEAALSRAEVETAITLAQAEELLTMRQGAVIEKFRFRVPFGGLMWEIDVFEGENAGLIIAEVEVPTADHAVQLPPWVGQEVTGDARYYNANLASDPIRGA
ncbi:hypothetical protein BAL199_28160 [alpha proteobacterium BAL199]|jgi:adenylate cyclase|nr:hypothetical protein BAL199_28160 [alpha proteobacterium BAL199]